MCYLKTEQERGAEPHVSSTGERELWGPLGSA